MNIACKAENITRFRCTRLCAFLRIEYYIPRCEIVQHNEVSFNKMHVNESRVILRRECNISSEIIQYCVRFFIYVRFSVRR